MNGRADAVPVDRGSSRHRRLEQAGKPISCRIKYAGYAGEHRLPQSGPVKCGYGCRGAIPCAHKTLAVNQAADKLTNARCDRAERRTNQLDAALHIGEERADRGDRFLADHSGQAGFKRFKDTAAAFQRREERREALAKRCHSALQR